MIQRIQTIYLLGAAVLTGLCFFFPVAVITTSTGQLGTLTFLGLTKEITGTGLSNLLSFVAGYTVVSTLGTIFFYKRRKRQITMCFVNIGLLIIISILTFVQIGILKNIPAILVNYKLPLVFPLISALLTYLAYRGVKKDDELVKSYDRLR